MSTGAFSVGPNKWDPSIGGCSIKYTDKGEFKHVKADGKNDARETWLGRHNCEITIGLEWKDDTRPGSDVDGPIDTAARNFLRSIAPRGPSGGQAFAWIEQDQDIHAVYDVTVESVETDRIPGAGKGKASIKLWSWSKPGASATVTKTPDPPNKWQPGAGSKPQPPGAPPKNFTSSAPKVDP